LQKLIRKKGKQFNAIKRGKNEWCTEPDKYALAPWCPVHR